MTGKHICPRGVTRRTLDDWSARNKVVRTGRIPAARAQFGTTAKRRRCGYARAEQQD